jgi:septal ring factor EnvC (AmiA/AmiB activator)
MEQLTLVQLGQIVQEFSKFNESLTDLKSALTNSLKETSRGDHEMAPQRIHVVNKVPQAFLDIIRYQFETLERWLDPINKLAASMPPAKRLSKTAKKVADNYKNIVKELEARAENETEDL